MPSIETASPSRGDPGSPLDRSTSSPGTTPTPTTDPGNATVDSESVFPINPPRGVWVRGELGTVDNASVGMDSLSYPTLVSEELLAEANVNVPLYPSDIALKGAGGQNLSIKGKCSIPIKVASTRMIIDCYVIANFPKIIIFGLEMQERFNVSIHTNSRLVDVNGISTVYCHTPEEVRQRVFPIAAEALNNVKLKETIVIPPNRDMVVLARVTLPPGTRTKYLEIDPTNLNQRYGLVCARVVVKTDTVVPIVVRNPYPRAYKLPRIARWLCATVRGRRP